jgi:hypothetical protein
MISYMILYMISYCEQDCVVVLASFPNKQNPVQSFNVKTDFDLQGDGLVWYARPQLFNCTVCPTGAKGMSDSHKEVSLVYFSTFEPIELTPVSIMQQAMLYDSASNQRLPCLCICPVANVLGRAPLIPCFIGGNSHPTIPHSFRNGPRLGSAAADTQRDRGNGSRLYEVNIWMWCYGRGRARMVSIAEAERIRAEPLSESKIRAAEEASQRRRCSGGGERGRRRSLSRLNPLGYHDMISYRISQAISYHMCI